MRRFIGERRHAPRYDASLPVTVSLHEEKSGGARAQSIKGRTHDLSATGLALQLPAIRIGERYLTGGGRTVNIALELPSGTVRLRAAPVRYERIEEETGETHYIIGAHIAEMSDEDRALFIAYLKKFKRG